MSEILTWDDEVLEVMGCITCEDLAPMRNRVTRGANLVMHGSAGTRPYVPIRDELDLTLTWKIAGRFDPDGAPYADPELGVEQNLEHYRDVFVNGADADTGEHDITLAFAGHLFTGTLQLRDYAQVRTGPGTAIILTRVTNPDGRLEDTGS